MKFPKGTSIALPGEESAPPRRRPNERTRIIAPGVIWFAPAPPPERAFATLYPRLQVAASTPGAVVMAGAVHCSGSIVGTSLLGTGDSVTFGRHTRCAIQLGDPHVSLRHLTVHVQGASDGRPLVRAWDLRTGHPFVTEDDVKTQAVTADGPLFMQLGPYTLAVLPLRLDDGAEWPEDHRDAWRRLPEREFITRLAEGSNADEPLPTPPGELPRSARRRNTRITRVQAATDLAGPGDAACAVAEIILEHEGTVRRFYISPEQLERGLLVGRYDRCRAEVVGDHCVSRVHLMIAAAGADIWAIDTASTHGTEAETGPIESRRLGDRETLLLAFETLLHFRRRKIAAG